MITALALSALVLVVPPEPVDPLMGLVADDYPPEAIRQRWQGVTRFRVDVDEDGAPRACTIVASSGYAALDTRSCEVVMTRGRFIPGRDQNGDAVAGTFTKAFRWQLPEDGGRPITIRTVAGGALECTVDDQSGARLQAEACKSMAGAMTKDGQSLPITALVTFPENWIEMTH